MASKNIKLYLFIIGLTLLTPLFLIWAELAVDIF